MARYRLIALLAAAASLAVMGCDAQFVPPTQAQFEEIASNFALNPFTTCEELKVAFGVPYLPTVSDPGQLGFDYEEATVTNAAGETIRLWYIPTELDRGTVIISMGAVGDMSCFLFIAHMLRFNGWSTVLYEYQGFGGSSGTAALASLNGDLDPVITWTLDRVAHERVTLLGVSVGTIPVVHAAVTRPNDINAIVLDAPMSLDAEIARFGLLLGNRHETYIAGLDPDLRIETQVAKITQPTLAFLYGLDEYATSAEFEGYVAGSAMPLMTFWFQELPHARGPYLGTREYFRTLEAFLTEVWAPAPAP